jgi:hypothetical protein
MNRCDKLIANERVGSFIPIIPQNAEVDMDRELGSAPTQAHPNEGISCTYDIQ